MFKTCNTFTIHILTAIKYLPVSVGRQMFTSYIIPCWIFQKLHSGWFLSLLPTNLRPCIPHNILFDISQIARSKAHCKFLSASSQDLHRPTFCLDSENTVEIVESCGKYSFLAEPGCHCVCGMLGRNVAGVLSLRVQQLDVNVESKTLVSTGLKERFSCTVCVCSTRSRRCLLPWFVTGKHFKGESRLYVCAG